MISESVCFPELQVARDVKFLGRGAYSGDFLTSAFTYRFGNEREGVDVKYFRSAIPKPGFYTYSCRKASNQRGNRVLSEFTVERLIKDTSCVNMNTMERIDRSSILSVQSLHCT